ncbi:N-acetylglucosamine-6-phosphate deacetylase [Ruminococcaceae bacterium YRB3002]|nr:N-acetylglucosamine-6-phosphate deacetylase [Ruminococcaceae bacterium YRB3002]
MTPGFVDTHIHGFGGFDTSDGNKNGIISMAEGLAACGVAAFCPTTMTISRDNVFKAFDAVMNAKDELENGDREQPFARILGIHLEGPFLSPERSGVQGLDHLETPEDGSDLIDELENRFPGLLKIIDIAPELPGSIGFIRKYSGRYVLSIAHTNCDYDTAVEAIDAGVTSVTHLLNAMPPVDKRAPGVFCAAMDRGIYVEVICDGIHVQAPVLRLIFNSFDEDKIIVISDSMRGAGMPDGEYYLGDVKVICKGGRTYYGPGGNLAGSVTDMTEEYNVLTAAGIPEDKVIKAMCSNPLKRLGCLNIH